MEKSLRLLGENYPVWECCGCARSTELSFRTERTSADEPTCGKMDAILPIGQHTRLAEGKRSDGRRAMARLPNHCRVALDPRASPRA